MSVGLPVNSYHIRDMLPHFLILVLARQVCSVCENIGLYPCNTSTVYILHFSKG